MRSFDATPQYRNPYDDHQRDSRYISQSILHTGPSNAGSNAKPSTPRQRGVGTPSNSREAEINSYPSSVRIYSPVESDAFDSLYSYHFYQDQLHRPDGCFYRCSSLAFRIENTQTYLWFYGFFTLGTFALLLYDICQREHLVRETLEPTWFVACDLVCISFLFFEILLRTMAHPEFWSSACNQFDVFILVLCIICTYFYAFIPSEEIFSAATLLTRYILQFTRLVIFLRWYHSRDMGFMDDRAMPLDRFDRVTPDEGKFWDHKSFFIDEGEEIPRSQLSIPSRSQHYSHYTDDENISENGAYV